MKVCWNITSRCNKNCIYCFRFNEKENTFLDKVKMLNYLYSNGVTKINFSGGEPFIYDYFEKILKLSKEKGIYNSVNTNASLLNEKNLYEKLKYVDKITISLDFIDDLLNYKYGIGQNHYEHIKQLLPIIKKINNSIKIQITTVVFAYNIYHIIDIYKELCNFDIDVWKIVRYYPIRGQAKKNLKELSVNDEIFDNIKSILCQQKSDFKIVFCNTCDMEKEIYIVLSSGKLIQSKNGLDQKVKTIGRC